MAAGSQKNEREKLRRRKKILFKKAYELGKLCDIDVAVIHHKNGCYFTYISTDKESWPQSMKEIVSNIALSNQPRSNLSSKMYILRQKICFRRISKVKPRALLYIILSRFWR